MVGGERFAVQQDVGCGGWGSACCTRKAKEFDLSCSEGVEVEAEEKRAEFGGEREMFYIGPLTPLESIRDWLSHGFDGLWDAFWGKEGFDIFDSYFFFLIKLCFCLSR